MNPKLEKARTERDKLYARYVSIGARLEKLDAQILEMENTDIIGIVRENGVSIEQLARLLAMLEENPTAAIPDKVEETEDIDEDMKEMEDED